MFHLEVKMPLTCMGVLVFGFQPWVQVLISDFCSCRSWRQQVTAWVVGCLPPTWKENIEFLPPTFKFGPILAVVKQQTGTLSLCLCLLNKYIFKKRSGCFAVYLLLSTLKFRGPAEQVYCFPHKWVGQGLSCGLAGWFTCSVWHHQSSLYDIWLESGLN